MFDTLTDKFKQLINTKETNAFNNLQNCHDYIVKTGKIYHFKALLDKDNKTLTVNFDKYKFRKGDQIISSNDVSYFVEDVEENYQYPLTIENQPFSINTQKIFYREEMIKFPSYLPQNNVNNTITINANNSSLGDVTNLSNINITYTTIKNDLNNVIENSYYVEELRPMMKEIDTCIAGKKPITQSKFSKFLRYLGTQGTELLKLFISIYSASINQ